MKMINKIIVNVWGWFEMNPNDLNVFIKECFGFLKAFKYLVFGRFYIKFAFFVVS